MPTKSFSFSPMARTPASPTTPMAPPAARPLSPHARPAARCAKLEYKLYLLVPLLGAVMELIRITDTMRP